LKEAMDLSRDRQILELDLWYGTWVHLNDILNQSLLQFVSVCVFLLSLLGKGSLKHIHPFFVGQQLGNHVPAETNTRNNRRIVGRVISIRSISYQRIVCGSVWVSPYRW
jgi:hypothetical protein